MPYEEVTCGEGNPQAQALRIRPFAENLPYDRNEMVVVGPQRNVKPSFKNLWVGRPGEMIAQALAGDMARDRLFSRVVTARDVLTAPLTMDGKVLQFAWAEENGRAMAELDLSVTVYNRDAGGNALFHKQYRLESPYRPRGKPEVFANAMSNLMQRFSLALRTDLCAASKAGNL